LVLLLNEAPIGVAHLPPIIVNQLILKTAFYTKWLLQTLAEGGQVERLLGRNQTNKSNYGPERSAVEPSLNFSKLLLLHFLLSHVTNYHIEPSQTVLDQPHHE
jgi:hypothetical protein